MNIHKINSLLEQIRRAIHQAQPSEERRIQMNEEQSSLGRGYCISLSNGYINGSLNLRGGVFTEAQAKEYMKQLQVLFDNPAGTVIVVTSKERVGA